MITNYKIFYYYSFEDSCYLATIPDLPGCIADGQTIEEAVKNVRLLSEDWIEIAKKAGNDIPSPTCQTLDINDININDVAVYILNKLGKITTKTLQKLLYYCKAWSTAWYAKPLFPEQFEAWVHGPINRELFNKHSGARIADVNMFKNNTTKDLSVSQKQFVDTILDVYDDIDAETLEKMTHKEKPWVIARGDAKPNERGNNEISEESLKKYYGIVVASQL